MGSYSGREMVLPLHTSESRPPPHKPNSGTYSRPPTDRNWSTVVMYALENTES